MMNSRRLRSPLSRTLVIAAVTLATVPWAFGTDLEKVLHNFAAKPALNPAAGLISDAAGNLYGTSSIGGNSCPPVCGTVFELNRTSKGWVYHVIYEFKGGTGDGQNPQGGLIFDAVGNLYGTTEYGGSAQCFGQPYGCGTVFKLTHTSSGWAETILYRFNDSAGGVFPTGNLAMDAAGNLYGAALAGGLSGCSEFGCGTIFELSPGPGGWIESVLYAFSGGSDGWEPGGNLVFDAKGSLYGATGFGAITNMNCCGVLFELTPAVGGWTFSALYTFTGGSDGVSATGLIFDRDGNLYGTAGEGGSATCALGCGTVFELMPDGGVWNFSVLHSFTGSDGEYPNEIVFDKKGNLYGTTLGGGGRGVSLCNQGGCGVVFELGPAKGGGWTETVLHRFGGKDGAQPVAGVLVKPNGHIFGTTYDGGTYNYGVVFELVKKPRPKTVAEAQAD